MKRILLSLLTIGVVGFAGVGASRAFFSDNQVSKGNTISAGTLSLQIDSTQHYDGLICVENPNLPGSFVWQLENPPVPSVRSDLVNKTCTGTWPLGSLISKKFFDLTDVKPGDEGENTISLHVTNDALACVRIDNMVTGHPAADLARGLFFTAWSDSNCNNVFDSGEQLLFSNQKGPASDVLNGKTYPLGKLLATDAKSCIGLRWCAGTMTITGNTISCDGASLGNEAQDDSVQADIAFYAEQFRNNSNFNCNNVDWKKILPSPIQ